MLERSPMSGGDDGWSRRHAMAAMGLPIALAGTGDGIATAAPVAGQDGNALQAAVLSPTAYGARGDGQADDTPAFQQAVDRLAALGGGTLAIPAGSFHTTTVHFPYAPAVIRVMGAGIGRTTWEIADPERPIIAIDPREPPRRALGARFEDFSVRAHPAGRADQIDQVAIDCVGFSDTIFTNLRFLSNGRGSVGTWFHTAAHPHLTYHQRFCNLVCQNGVGPGRVIRATNAGSSASNTNLIAVENFWIYANSGMEVAFDLADVTGYTVRQGLIESSGRDGIRLGTAGIVEAVWMEDLSGSPLVFTTRKIGTSSHNIVRDVYLSGYAGEIVIPADSANNILTNVTGGQFRIRREDPLGGNILLNSGATRSAPTVSRVAGPGGRLRKIQAYRSSSLSERWNLLYELTTEAAGTVGLRVLPPPGSHLTAIQLSALDPASGTPRPTATGWPIGEAFVTAPAGRPVTLVIQLSLE